MWRMMALGVVLLAGCPAGGDDASGDGGVVTTGLVLTWAVVPAVPGPVRADVTVQELHIAYSSVRSLGDAAPGDARTSRGRTDLEWEDGQRPPPIEFDEAPPGIYSALELGVGGGDEGFSVHGEVDLAGTWTPFEIEDEAANPVALALAVDLRPGMVATVPLEIDLASVLAAVPFADLPRAGGHLELRRDDPRMRPVRAALVAAVHVAGAGIAR